MLGKSSDIAVSNMGIHVSKINEFVHQVIVWYLLKNIKFYLCYSSFRKIDSTN